MSSASASKLPVGRFSIAQEKLQIEYSCREVEWERTVLYRSPYGRLLALTNEPAFRDGAFFGLNPANNQNPQFGQVGSEPAGGHWLYAFLRFDPISWLRFLVVVNLHPREEMTNAGVLFPAEAIAFLDIQPNERKTLHLDDRLGGKLKLAVDCASLGGSEGVNLPILTPLTACFFEISLGRLIRVFPGRSSAVEEPSSRRYAREFRLRHLRATRLNRRDRHWRDQSPLPTGQPVRPFRQTEM